MVFNYILQSISPTTLDIDWGDGLETITFNGYYIGSHTYSANNFFGITFQGDLQYLRSVTVNGGGIFISNVMNINNLTSLTLSNNILPDFDITGLLYLTHLDLSNNNLVDVDKFFNILDSNGLLNGYINTSGMGIAGLNAHVTTISQVSRNNLILKGWTLVYD
jgi:Leucine-rich repeat (LRR) protein